MSETSSEYSEERTNNVNNLLFCVLATLLLSSYFFIFDELSVVMELKRHGNVLFSSKSQMVTCSVSFFILAVIHVVIQNTHMWTHYGILNTNEFYDLNTNEMKRGAVFKVCVLAALAFWFFNHLQISIGSHGLNWLIISSVLLCLQLLIRCAFFS